MDSNIMKIIKILFSIAILFQISNFNLAYANNNGTDSYMVYNTSPYMTVPCYVNKLNGKIICQKYEGLWGTGHTEDYLSGKYDFELNKSFLEQIKNKRTQHNSYDLTILLLNHMDYFAMYYPISDINKAILYLDEKSKNNVVHMRNKIINSSLNYRRMYDKKRLKLDNKFQNNKNKLIQMINEYSGNSFMEPTTMSFQSIDFKNKDNSYNWYFPSKLKIISDKNVTSKHSSGYLVKLDGSEYEVFYIQIQIQSKQSQPKTARFVKLKNQSQNDFFNKVLLKEYDASFLKKQYNMQEMLYKNRYDENQLRNLIKDWQEQLKIIQLLSLDSRNKQFIQNRLNELKL